MGVIPLQASWTQKADGCRLCAESRSPRMAAASDAWHLGQVLAGALVFTGGLALAVLNGPTAWIGLGVVAGILAGALYRYRVTFHRTMRAAHAKELSQLAEDADNRVQSVIKQFEWAVNDLARIRSQLEESEVSVRTLTERARHREHQNEQLVRQISRLRERLAEIAMAASLTASGKEVVRPLFEEIPFMWGLHFDGPRARLELATHFGDVSPTRLRVLDRSRQIVAVSGVSVVSPDGALEFQLEPPLDLVADLDAGHDISYALEALVDLEWRPVRLMDSGRRTRSAVDTQGQLSRVSALEASRLTVRRDGRGSALN